MADFSEVPRHSFDDHLVRAARPFAVVGALVLAVMLVVDLTALDGSWAWCAPQLLVVVSAAVVLRARTPVRLRSGAVVAALGVISSVALLHYGPTVGAGILLVAFVGAATHGFNRGGALLSVAWTACTFGAAALLDSAGVLHQTSLNPEGRVWLRMATATVVVLSAFALFHLNLKTSMRESLFTQMIHKELMGALGAVNDLPAGLQLCAEAAVKTAGVDSAGIYLTGPARAIDLLVHPKGLSAECVREISHFPSGSDRARRVGAGRAEYGRLSPGADPETGDGLMTYGLIPVRHGGQVIAALYVLSRASQELSDTRRRGLEAVAASIGEIIARLKSEETLAESEKHFRDLFERAHAVALIIDPDTGAIVDANPAASKLYGWTLEELRALNIAQLNTLTDVELRAELDLASRQSRTHFEFEHRCADGSARSVEVDTGPILIGGRTLLYSSVHDITESKQTEAILRVQLELATALVGARSLEDGLEVCLKTALGVARADAGGILLFDERTRTFDYAVQKGLNRELEARLRDIEVRVARNGRRISTFEFNPPEVVQCGGLRVTGAIPMIQGDRVIGCLLVLSRATGPLPEARRRALETVAAQASHAVVRLWTEQALSANETRHRQLVEAANDWIWEIDADGVLTYCSPQSRKIVGYDPDELVGTKICSLAPAHEAERVKAFFCSSLGRRDSFYGFEHVNVHKDGSRVVLEANAVPVLSASGNLLGHRGMSRDITERRRSEDALRASEQHHRALIAALPDVIMRFDSEGRHLFASENVRGVTGIAANEFAGKTHRELGFPDPLCEFWEHAIRQPFVTGSPYETEFELDGPSGRVTFNWRLSPDLDQNGKVKSVLAVARDVTERKKAEAAEEELRAELLQAQKMELVGRLAGGVAHDFNNMLQVIEANAAGIQETLPAESDLQESVGDILDCARRSADLTRQLLAFARKQTVSPKVLDLNTAVESVLRMLRRLIGENIALRWEPGDAGRVNVDPSQIDQLLTNLCVNARDAIGESGAVTIKTDRVSVSPDAGGSGQPGEFARLTVTDDGCGMSEDVLAHVFEPFFSTKGVSQGTGLGLATVYGIASQNGGFVRVHSVPEAGTRFEIHLPLATGTGTQSENELPRRANGGHEMILVVEDDPRILRSVARILERRGYAVVAAASPEDAVRIAELHRDELDLLLTDVVMPGINGRELADRVSAIKPELKRLFMSGYTADVMAVHGMRDTGMAFLQKPFSPSELVAKVREVLDGIEPRRSSSAPAA